MSVAARQAKRSAGCRACCRRAAGLALAVALLLTGCALPGGEDRPVTAYLLEAGAGPTPPGTARTCLSLRVEPPGAAPGYDSPRMAYVEQAHRLDYFAYHRWVEAPPQMLQPVLIGSLERSGLFRAVLGPDARGRADRTLAVELLRLRQVFGPTPPSRVELALRVGLFDPAGQRLLASRVFEFDTPAPQDTPYGGVLAANRAVEQFLDALRAFLAERLAPGAGC